jgi:hypothetical protein
VLFFRGGGKSIQELVFNGTKTIEGVQTINSLSGFSLQSWGKDLASYLIREVIKRGVSLKIFYMVCRISSSIITFDRRKFKTVGKARGYYLVSTKQSHFSFCTWRGHPLAFPFVPLHIALCLVVLDVC